jgi:hypothetical protein
MTSEDASMGIDAPDRSSRWLELLRAVTERSERWAVHGDVAEGFSGEGDVDLAVPADDWPELEHEFVAWARATGLGPVVSCRHRPGVLILVALAPEAAPFYEVEARAERYFKGWTAYRAEDLAPLMEMDPAGYRKLRPGAAALLKLVPNGLRTAGRPKWGGAKLDRVSARLRADPAGVEAAAALFGAASASVAAGARAVAAGGWDRRAMAAAEARAALQALRHGTTLYRRARFRIGSPPRCEVLEAVARGRLVPGDAERWLAAVTRDHRILSAGSPPARGGRVPT